MEVKGRIHRIGETQTIGGNGFTKRELVIKTEGDYPQFITVEFVKDKTSILDKYKSGDAVEVGINLEGREWINPKGEAKYFNSIKGWMVKKLEMTNKQEDDLPW